ncbi:uncharacterized protein LOC134311277 [Trichomycterus rosablanca]|uniref:uncharacterized protein LOC134311277 n=1 Tax=Trichomycterus rosablanca TaxID=2290929 RepID=UPI002F35B4DE
MECLHFTLLPKKSSNSSVLLMCKVYLSPDQGGRVGFDAMSKTRTTNPSPTLGPAFVPEPYNRSGADLQPTRLPTKSPTLRPDPVPVQSFVPYRPNWADPRPTRTPNKSPTRRPDPVHPLLPYRPSWADPRPTRTPTIRPTLRHFPLPVPYKPSWANPLPTRTPNISSAQRPAPLPVQLFVPYKPSWADPQPTRTPTIRPTLRPEPLPVHPYLPSKPSPQKVDHKPHFPPISKTLYHIYPPKKQLPISSHLQPTRTPNKIPIPRHETLPVHPYLPSKPSPQKVEHKPHFPPISKTWYPIYPPKKQLPIFGGCQTKSSFQGLILCLSSHLYLTNPVGHIPSQQGHQTKAPLVDLILSIHLYPTNPVGI